MANPWDNDPIIAPAPATASAVGGNPWDQDEIIEEAPAADFSRVTGSVDSGPAPLRHPDGRLTEAGWQAERDELAAQDPLEGSSHYARYLAGLGVAGRSIYDGVRQVGTEGAFALSRALAGSSEAREALRRQQAPVVDRMRRERDDTVQGERAIRDDPAGIAGNVVGTAATIFGPGVLARGTAAAAAAMPATIRGNALQGLLLGTAQPVGTEGGRGQNAIIGGAAGGGGAAAFKAAGAGYNALRSIGQPGVDSADRAAANMLVREAADPAALGRSAPSAIAGVQRTLAEETRDEGLARLEQTLRGQPGFNWAARDSANNIARTNALEAIAGTDADMAAAAAARGAAASSARGQAMQSGPVQIPQTMAAIDHAIDAQQGRPAVQGALQQVRALLMRPAAQGAPAGTFTPEDRIAVLDNVRMTIGDMLSGKLGGESAAALRGSSELMAVRDALNDEIGAQAPSFTRYLNAYRQGSVPINRMEVGRELLDVGTRNIQTDAAGNRMLAAKPIANAARDLDGLAARATGFAKAKASDILSSSDIATIKALQDDLERQSFARSAGTGGNSASAARAGVLSRTGRRAGEAVAGLFPYGAQIRSFAQFLDEKGTERVNQRLAYLVANPDEARRVIAALPPAGQRIVGKALTELAGVTAASAAVTQAPGAGGLEIDIVGGTPVPADQYGGMPYR